MTDRLKTHWMIDWLTDWLIDFLDWLIDWLIDWMIDWLIDWLIDEFIYWLIEWFWIDWLTYWLIDWLIDCSGSTCLCWRSTLTSTFTRRGRRHCQCRGQPAASSGRWEQGHYMDQCWRIFCVGVGGKSKLLQILRQYCSYRTEGKESQTDREILRVLICPHCRTNASTSILGKLRRVGGELSWWLTVELVVNCRVGGQL